MAAKEIIVKKYIVRLNDDERQQLATLIRKEQPGATMKARISCSRRTSRKAAGRMERRSDGLEFSCWNGDVVRMAFIIDAFDREIIAWSFCLKDILEWLIPLSQVLPYLAASPSPRDDFGRRFGLYPSCPGAFRWLSFCDVAYA